jgi:hypothetical protein
LTTWDAGRTIRLRRLALAAGRRRDVRLCVEGRNRDMDGKFPECRKCSAGVLIPLSDYGRDGAPITYKAWVCTNPGCGYNVRIDNGEISLGRTIQQSTK